MDLIEVSDNQNRHPWELSRTACVLKQLRKLGIHGNVLDIGCGDSYFDRRLLEECPGVTVYGMDIYLKDEIHEGNFHAVSSPEHLPDMKFDFILMMDVLEHIENDRTYLREIARKYLTADRVAKNGDEAGGGISSSPFRHSTPFIRCTTKNSGIFAATTTGNLGQSSLTAALQKRDGHIFISHSFWEGFSRKTRPRISASGKSPRRTLLLNSLCGYSIQIFPYATRCHMSPCICQDCRCYRCAR